MALALQLIAAYLCRRSHMTSWLFKDMPNWNCCQTTNQKSNILPNDLNKIQFAVLQRLRNDLWWNVSKSRTNCSASLAFVRNLKTYSFSIAWSESTTNKRRTASSSSILKKNTQIILFKINVYSLRREENRKKNKWSPHSTHPTLYPNPHPSILLNVCPNFFTIKINALMLHYYMSMERSLSMCPFSCWPNSFFLYFLLL